MDINVNVSGTITLTADKLLLAALSGAKTIANIQTLPQAPAPEEPHPTTPVQYAQPNRPVSAPAQVAPTAAPTVPISPTQAYAPAPTHPNAPITPPPAAPVTTYAAPTATQGNPAPVAAAPAYNIDDLARAAAQLMDAGKQQQLFDLLKQFQVQGLRDLKPEQYGAFATVLRQMGARI